MTDAQNSEPARSAAAERMRLHRERRRRGLRCVTIELCVTEEYELVRRGLLTREAWKDKSAVAKALRHHLDRTLGRGIQGVTRNTRSPHAGLVGKSPPRRTRGTTTTTHRQMTVVEAWRRNENHCAAATSCIITTIHRPTPSDDGGMHVHPAQGAWVAAAATASDLRNRLADTVR